MIPQPRTATPPTPSDIRTYFGLFRPCGCGHSSAWHDGAFGDAWRAGQQVHGPCEAVLDRTAATCSCRHFEELAG